MKETFLAILRNRNTSMEQFRQAAEQLGLTLAAESAAYISKKRVEVETPLANMTAEVIAEQVVLIPILRAGLGFLPPFLKFYPDALIGFLGEKREESTAIPYLYYKKLPPFKEDNPILLLDPMLATGGSACLALKVLCESGASPSQITLISAVAAPEGIARIHKEYPEAHLIIAHVDDKLDENKYIVPGLGDFGDRFFGTVD